MVLVVALLPVLASAQEIRLSGFGTVVGGGVVDKDYEAFKELAGDLGQVLGPKMFGPAETTGALGFDLAIEFSVTNVDEGATQWQKASDAPSSTLNTIQLQFRKGLPYSFEVGGMVTHLLGSDLWGVGMHIKYAFVEGYKLAPDVALRGGVSTVLGSRDLSMLIAGGDLTFSKSFGLGGVLSLAPFAGYSIMYVRASSFVLGIFPDENPRPTKFVIEGQDVVRHRGFVGFKLVAVKMALAFEIMIGDGLQTFTTKLGADF